jgi:hypothetical protein
MPLTDDLPSPRRYTRPTSAHASLEVVTANVHPITDRLSVALYATAGRLVMRCDTTSRTPPGPTGGVSG